MEKVVVTKYPGLVEYLIELNLVDEATPVVRHATVEDIQNKHVIGTLPLWLASRAAKITDVYLKLPASRRSEELSVEEVREAALSPRTYTVREVAFNDG